jgi:hypothetical protein
LDILARGKSNEPALGNGADVFRRANQVRVTPACAVARVAFTALASGPAEPHDLQVPGFDVAIVPETAARAGLVGHATVIHRRTGEATALAFSAQYDGKAGFKCRVGGQRLTLADLDAEAVQSLRMHALGRLAEQATTATRCQAFLDMAELVQPLPDDRAAFLARLFAIALITFLENSRPDATDASAWKPALVLLKRVTLQPGSEHARRAQEALWEHLAALRVSRRRPGKALRALAEQLGFDMSA